MEVSPSTLEFKGDFLSASTEHLTISNTGSTPIAFKVKTTAPKLYSVRPNASVVPAGESLKVAIILQAFSQPLTKHYKCKDKFLIVSLPCSESHEASKVSEFWAELEAANKPALVSKKLRVNYLIESDGDEIREEAEPSVSSSHASESAGVGAAGIAAAGAAAAGAAHVPESAPVETAGSDESVEPASAKVVEPESADYSKIDQLNEKFDKTEKEQPVVKVEEPFGVSLPLTVILMVLAFIIGWAIF